MKERRHSGATHSFRLSMEAAEIVDSINHPRRLGGKSRKVSDAIEWYFNRDEEKSSVADMQASMRFWVKRYDALVAEFEHLSELVAKKVEKEPSPPAWWRRIFRISEK